MHGPQGGDTDAMDIFNLFADETDTGPDESDPLGYRGRASRLGPKLGASRLGMSVYDLPPGEAICPYHFEWTDEEWLIVISGSPVLRTPDGERTLEPGDVTCFPPGPAGAHHVRNASDTPLRVAILSTKNEFGIAVPGQRQDRDLGRATPTTCSADRRNSTTGTEKNTKPDVAAEATRTLPSARRRAASREHVWCRRRG